MPEEIKISSSKVIIVADATFFGKRKDKMGTLVFKDVINNKIVATKYIQSETVDDYKQLFEFVKEKGFEVIGVILDGKRGLNKAFKDIPIQLCHFHQIAIVKRYLTNNPRLEASIDLLQITKKLPNIKKESFEKALNIWYVKYKSFLEERMTTCAKCTRQTERVTLNSNNGKLSPTNPRLLAAYKSLRNNLPYLFTYKKFRKFDFQNTTNSLDGGVFAHMKKLMKLHQGLAKKRKIKLIDEYLSNYNKK